MSKANSITPGDTLYHHTNKPVEGFNAERENVVYFGRTEESVLNVGGSGHIGEFTVMDDLGAEGSYGSRTTWGAHPEKDWVSLPAEVAAEKLSLKGYKNEHE